MPIYEFQCPICGEIQEAILPPGDSSAKGPPCKSCGADQSLRVISAHAKAPVGSKSPGHTCCGRQERCERPPCSAEGSCSRG
ncbi:MAG: FmdB family zinc ribbon protein [Desulfobacterota bacterium U4-17]